MLSTAVLWTSLASLAISAAPQQPWRLVDTNRTSSASGLVEDVLSPAIKSRIDTILEKHNVTGHSLAVVRLGAQVEYHQWGNRTEDGEAPTKEVRRLFGSTSFHSLSVLFVPDAILSWFVLESIPSDLGWDHHRRLCAWEECYSASRRGPRDSMELENKRPFPRRLAACG